MLGSLWPVTMIIFGEVTDIFVHEANNNALRDEIIKNATITFNLDKNTSRNDIV